MKSFLKTGFAVFLLALPLSPALAQSTSGTQMLPPGQQFSSNTNGPK